MVVSKAEGELLPLLPLQQRNSPHFEEEQRPREDGSVHSVQRHSIPNVRAFFWKILLVGSLMTTALVYFGRGNGAIVPTEEEWSLLQQYYGPFLWDRASSSQWSAMSSMTTDLVQRMRQAQQVADVAQEELNSNDLEGALDFIEEDAASQEAEPHDANLRRTHRVLKHDDSETDDAKHHHHGNKESDELPVGCETTIVVMRHCEKGSVAEHCAFAGYERSVYLATLFGEGVDAKYPAPSFIFAEAPIARHSRHKMNFREVETVGPLSVATHVNVDDSYTDETLYDLAHRLKHEIRRGTLCGQVVVIVWKHSRIGELAHWLGCGPHQGCPIDYSGKTFDQLWQIRYIYTNLWNHSTRKKRFVQHPDIPYWNVFGSVQYENFDPLAFSNRYGDAYSRSSDAYRSPDDSASLLDNMEDFRDALMHGGMKNDNWEDEVVAYPERKYSTDTAGWKVTMVGLSNPSSSRRDDDIEANP